MTADSPTLQQPELPPSLSLAPFFRPVVPFVILFAATTLAYFNADHDEFFFDDTGSLIFNPQTRRLGESLRQLFRAPLKADEQLSRVSFAASYQISRMLGKDGFDVRSYFVFNVALHALNACLVYVLLRSLFRLVALAPPSAIPLLLAVIFAVHPIHGSSVAYIAQRRGELATSFYLLAILAYLSLRHRRSAGGPWTAFQILLTASLPLCFWLGLKSKSFAITLPAMILAIEYVVRARDRQQRRRFWRILAPAILVIGAAIVWFLQSHRVIDIATGEIRPQGPAELWGPWPHFLSETRALIHYWKLILLPLPRWMCIDHEFPVSMSLWDGYAFIALVVNILVLAVAWTAARRGFPLAALGTFWFYIAMAPYAVVPQFDLLVEYKAYLASIGAILIVAEIVRRLSISTRISAPIALSLAAVILLVTTWRRNVVYQSPLNLWTDAVRKYPDAARPRLSLGAALLNQDKIAEAKAQFIRALEIEPQYPAALSNLAIILDDEGKTAEAIQKYEEALKIDPNYAEGHNNLAGMLLKQNKLDEATEHFREAVRIKPDYYMALCNLGVLLLEKGRPDEALEQWNAAIEAEPTQPDAYIQIAHLYQGQNKTDEAIRALERAVTAAPDYIDGWIELANLLAVNGRTNQAIACFKEVIRIKPNLAAAHNSLGTLYSSQGRFDNAVVHFTEAIREQPKFVAAIVNLANTHQRQGRTELAFQMYRQALTIDSTNVAARFYLASALLQAKRTDEAIAEYKELVRQKPNYAEGRLYYGLALESKGEIHEARVQIGEALRMRPDLMKFYNQAKAAQASQPAAGH